MNLYTPDRGWEHFMRANAVMTGQDAVRVDTPELERLLISAEQLSRLRFEQFARRLAELQSAIAALSSDAAETDPSCIQQRDACLDEIFELSEWVVDAHASEARQLVTKAAFVREFLEPDDDTILHRLVASLCDDITRLFGRAPPAIAP